MPVYVDISRCIGCRSCEVACKRVHDGSSHMSMCTWFVIRHLFQFFATTARKRAARWHVLPKRFIKLESAQPSMWRSAPAAAYASLPVLLE